jgi:hypothetical protein
MYYPVLAGCFQVDWGHRMWLIHVRVLYRLPGILIYTFWIQSTSRFIATWCYCKTGVSPVQILLLSLLKRDDFSLLGRVFCTCGKDSSVNACFHSDKNILLSVSFLKTCRRKYVIVALCGYGTWSLILREEHIMRVFESRILNEYVDLRSRKS